MRERLKYHWIDDVNVRFQIVNFFQVLEAPAIVVRQRKGEYVESECHTWAVIDDRGDGRAYAQAIVIVDAESDMKRRVDVSFFGVVET